MFSRIAKITAETPDRKFLVTCSFLEIYNEVLFDLLDPSGRRARKREGERGRAGSPLPFITCISERETNAPPPHI
eukprot:3773200-Pleurochrysis_carterae.AAC.1